MFDPMSSKALSAIKSYLLSRYQKFDLEKIEDELNIITKIDFSTVDSNRKYYSYESLQKELATLNEKSATRKSKGVYYTPDDIVEFILINSIKFFYDKLENEHLSKFLSDSLPYEKFCYDCTFFDPTCGSGAFLLAVLELKFKLLEENISVANLDDIHRVISTIFGNDINSDSVLITKLRLFLYVLNKFDSTNISGLSHILNEKFFQCDFVNNSNKCGAQKYDIILGNPPYVEDSRATLFYFERYGNIYANVLSNASRLLKDNGVMGFIIPLSYISTPRMKKIREELFQRLPKQYILSFADRPDCLFVSVHQKLCILLAGNKSDSVNLFTSSYQYWSKEERDNLFDCIKIVENHFWSKDFIPKIGTHLESKIYKKMLTNQKSLANLFVPNGVPIYLNMRTTYWIKAFSNEHTGADYKIFKCDSVENANLSLLLLNSSLFWWYWVCISDCWHITNKELNGFKLPEFANLEHIEKIETLVKKLENQLESTKVYVGTKQTAYEYKHKLCTDIIHEIDDYVNAFYHLDVKESMYIKNFAYRYRTGGGCVES